MSAVKTEIDKLFADRSVSLGKTLDNLEEIIRHAIVYADVLRDEFGAEPIGERVEAMLAD